MRGNHWKKDHRAEMIEKESWRRNREGAIVEEEAWRRHLGSIWELSGKHLGWIWESSPRRHPERPRPHRRLEEVLDFKSDAHLSPNRQVL